MKRLFLLDAYALIYRAYYAFIKNPRVTSNGLNTSAIFGFTNSLLDIIKKENPSHIAVVFDPPTPTFRHEMHDTYKANRNETPEDIKKAVPYIKEIITAFNIPILQVDRYEADDVIGTIAKKAEQHNIVTYMVTPDKDFGQLVSENIFIYKPKRGDFEMEILGEKEICAKYSIKSPIQVIDILALWGDVSDNVPGAQGIGEKTAIKLISEFGSVENLYKNIDKIKGKQQENLIQSKEIVEKAKVLVTIEINVPIEFDEQQLEIKNPNKEALHKIFEDLEFRNMINRVFSSDSQTQPTPVKAAKPTIANSQGSLFDFFDAPATEEQKITSNYKTIQDINHTYYLVDTLEKQQQLINQLLSLKEFCFDTETTGIDANNNELVGMSFCFKSYEAYYVPVPANQKDAQILVNLFKPVFENPNSKKIGQNIKYDMLVLSWYGVNIQGVLFDTMLAHYLIQPDLRHNMNFMAEQYLNYTPVAIEELIGKKGINQATMRSAAIEKVKEYASEDADITWQLKKILEVELEKNGFTPLFEEIEMPLVFVLQDMEKTGVKINVEDLNAYAKVLRAEIIETEKNIFSLAGMEFNISSPKQLGEVLFDRLKIDSNAKLTKTKQYSTGEEILSQLVNRHPIVNAILDYRSLQKLLSTYIEALPKLINPKTGRIHTSYNQAVTSTGRLSSNNPNLQNIPIREDRGREIRKAFIPSNNENIFVSADYSQIELRLMAHLSQDEGMILAFQNSEDIHTATAAKINKIDISEVTREMRSKAKTANFGIIYGISAFGLSQRLNISRTEAKELIDNYFISYPKVKEYMDKSIAFARDNGFVETLFGRKRYLADINSRNVTVRGFAERNAINAPLQGSAADIIKIAMIRIFARMQELNLKSKMILQVHDELNFDVYKPELTIMHEIIKTEMQQAVQLKVPLTIDLGIGENWLEAH